MSNYPLSMSLNNILKDIDLVNRRISVNAELSNRIKLTSRESIRNQALGHSLRIEGIGSNVRNGFELPKQVRKDYDTSFQRLLEAREHLLENGITDYSLPELGYLIDPEPNHRMYRTKEVMFGGFEGALPPTIIHRIGDLTYRLNDDSTSFHPVTRAIDLHLSLVQIHPFIDGNGRAARLCQDVYLESNGYTPPVIREEERAFYIDLMKQSMIDRMSGSSIFEMGSGEKLLHKFISVKVLESMTQIEKEAGENRIYEVKIRNPGVEIIRSVSNSLRRKLRGQNIPGKITKIDNGGIRITGDLSLKMLEAFLPKDGEVVEEIKSIAA